MKRLFLAIFICSLFLISQQYTRSAENSATNYSTYISQLFTRLQSFFLNPNKPVTSTKPKKKVVENKSALFSFIYNPELKTFTLLSPTQEIIYKVIGYQFSPHKNYFIIYQETSTGIASRGAGEWLGEKISKRIQLLLYNPHTGKLHASFDPGIIRMYSFDPSEELLMIAGPRKPWGTLFGASKPSTIHTSPTKNFRQPSDTGDILQYQLFDLTSQTKNVPIKTIENVQAIQFNKKHELFVKYDDGIAEKIEFKRTSLFINTLINPMLPSSFTNQWDITTTPLNEKEEKNLIGAMYNETGKNFIVTVPSLKEEFKNISSYQLSPEKKFISLQSVAEGLLEGPKRIFSGVTNQNTTFINRETGITWNPLLNVIFYMFNADETRLIVFYTPTGWGGTYNNPEYHLFDTASQKSIKTFENIKFAYFEKSTDAAEKLTVIDSKGKITAHNPITGLSYQEIEKQRSEQKEKQNPVEPPTKQSSSTQKVHDMAKQLVRYVTSAMQTNNAQKSSSDMQKLPTTEPLSQTNISPTKEEEEEEQYEDISFLMKNFKNQNNKETVEKIISELSHFNDDDQFSQKDRAVFLTQFNAYDHQLKESFCSFFFALPAGHLNISKLPIHFCQGTKFRVDITNDYLYITDEQNKKTIFTSDELDNDLRTMAFNFAENYLAIGYDSTTAMIDIFKQSEKTFEKYQTIQPKDFTTIIGLKYITTPEKNDYLFFIDTTYKMSVYDIQKMNNQDAKRGS